LLEPEPGAAIKAALQQLLAAVGDSTAAPETRPPKKKRPSKEQQDAA
jgi:hypothetical protein